MPKLSTAIAMPASQNCYSARMTDPSILSPDDLPQLAARLQHATQANSWLVACLCAAWCGTCREYRQPFAALSQRYPDACFVWIDIEEHPDALGDLDVENFPTLLIQPAGLDGQAKPAGFFGTVLPHADLLARLLEQITTTTAHAPRLPDETPPTLEWLREQVERAGLAPAD